MKVTLEIVPNRSEVAVQLSIDSIPIRFGPGEVTAQGVAGVSLTPIAGTRDFTLDIPTTENTLKVWAKKYESSDPAGAGVTIVTANPYRDDDGTLFLDAVAPPITTMTISASAGKDYVKVVAWSIDFNGSTFDSNASEWKQVSQQGSSSSSSSSSDSSSSSSDSSSSDSSSRLSTKGAAWK